MTARVFVRLLSRKQRPAAVATAETRIASCVPSLVMQSASRSRNTADAYWRRSVQHWQAKPERSARAARPTHQSRFTQASSRDDDRCMFLDALLRAAARAAY